MEIIKNHLDKHSYWGELKEVKYIIVHHTWTKTWITWRNIRNYFNKKNVYVSAHFWIDKKWIIEESVPETNKAWHCWESKRNWEENLNNCTIWIEVVSNGKEYKKEQIKATKELILMLMDKYWLGCFDVLRHADISEWRKWDIWPNFYINQWFKTWKEYTSSFAIEESLLKNIKVYKEIKDIFNNYSQDRKTKELIVIWLDRFYRLLAKKTKKKK